MADNVEKLQQVQTLQENHLGFKGILSGIADELIPDGYVPDMENLSISTEGLVEAVLNPVTITKPTSTIAAGAIAMFKWFKDDGTSEFFAQYGQRVFSWNGSTWKELRKDYTTIDADITSTSATSISVAKAFTVASGFTIKIDSEIMNVTAGGTGTTWTVTRGYEGSTAATHTSGADVEVEILNSTDVASFTGGMGTKMYFVNRTTQVMEYDGTTAKEALTPTTNGASVSHAPMGDYITIWKNRIFVGGKIKMCGITTSASGTPSTTDYSYGVCWSNIHLYDEAYLATSGDETKNYDGGFPADGYAEFRTAENSQITGILAAEQNLYIFLESAVFSFSGYSNDNFNATDVYHGGNTPNSNAFVRAGGIYFISDSGIFAMAETPVLISKNIEGKIDTLSGKQSCAYWDDRLWFCTNGKLVAMNMKTSAWEKYNITGQYMVYAADNLYIAINSGAYAGNIVYWSHTVNGTGYLAWYLETPVHNQGITAANKRYKSMFIYHKSSEDKISIDVYRDYLDTSIRLDDISSDLDGYLWYDVTTTPVPSDALVWNSTEWSTMERDMEITQRYIIFDLARTIKIKFSGTGYVGLLGYSIVFKPKRKQGVR